MRGGSSHAQEAYAQGGSGCKPATSGASVCGSVHVKCRADMLGHALQLSTAQHRLDSIVFFVFAIGFLFLLCCLKFLLLFEFCLLLVFFICLVLLLLLFTFLLLFFFDLFFICYYVCCFSFF